MQQPVAHVAGDDDCGTALQQTVDESPGRCTSVKHPRPTHRHFCAGLDKILKRSVELQPTSTDEPLHRDDRKLVSLGHLPGRVENGCAVHRDTVVSDEHPGFVFAASESRSHQRCVDSLGSGHVSATGVLVDRFRTGQHEVRQTGEIVEHPVGRDRAVVGRFAHA